MIKSDPDCYHHVTTNDPSTVMRNGKIGIKHALQKHEKIQKYSDVITQHGFTGE